MSAVQQAAPIELTPSAAEKIRELLAEEADDDLCLRVFVTGGGCSGFQ
ncbi:MAG: iron-sulfur cluster insertion protein ErpA, partial [Pseudomonadota bacterium]|nr:iron-sulfur cluster insertion protein ErpA [Pseudomonadota bacterium]